MDELKDPLYLKPFFNVKMSSFRYHYFREDRDGSWFAMKSFW